jgi:hypothetical protein
MIVIDRRRQVHGDLQTHIAQLTELRRDLMQIANGEMPVPRILEAPMLDQVVLAKRATPCLIGHLDQAANDSRVIQTSEIWVADWDGGWVRTRNRFYRIRRALDLDTK